MSPRPIDLYLELMKRSLLGLIDEDVALITFEPGESVNWKADKFDRRLREDGADWPSRARSMIGSKRMDNLRQCIERVLADSVPGDLIETGVWRGGATIFMRAVLEAYGIRDRKVWVADSFEGVPAPNVEAYPADEGLELFSQHKDVLAVSLDEVKRNFERYGLLDNQVEFLEGWFKDTLPRCPITRLSVLRLDGDLYESTMDALVNLHPRLSPGGFCIIDDYDIHACARAVGDYRAAHSITEELIEIDAFGVFWRKRSEA